MDVDIQKCTPMMQQYLSVKEKHRNHILFFRLGDFYEMFFDDAITVSKELELTLTGKDCGLDERAPMCGVPYHACDTYVARLIKKGYKVAICEQVEDPSSAKGIVQREVVRVVTPGTLIESNMLNEGDNNYIVCICCLDTGMAIACADSSTGQLFAGSFKRNELAELINEIGRYNPSEVLFNEGILAHKPLTDFLKNKLRCVADLYDNVYFEYENAQKRLETHFQKPLNALGLENAPIAVGALGALLAYLYDTQKKGLERITTVSLVDAKQFMTLDITARRNLEVFQTMRGGEKHGSLLWVLDRTKTAMGKRLLHAYLDKPLLDPTRIQKRLNAVDELKNDTLLCGDIVAALKNISDLERLMTRIVYGNAVPREYKSLQLVCDVLPDIKQRLGGCHSVYLLQVYEEIDILEDVRELLAATLADELPAQLSNGGVIREGCSQELDELRSFVHNTKNILMKMEADEKEKTGIKNLKIAYNRVFGYYIEVSKSNLSMVPESYTRKQTLANCERYITQGLKELEAKILTAGERVTDLENRLFLEMRTRISEQQQRIQNTADALAKLDVYQSLATAAIENDYCRPEVNLSDVIDIQEGRHPVVERISKGSMFVSNDTFLNGTDAQIAIITGPNMAGKSTYMRQTALIVLMAQIGSFVPASRATIGLVDGIYTRVGASDDLACGQSTFMVEMSEVADILKSATSKSLLILDEIGRGTSTFDGMSIARAVLEYIGDKRRVGAKTLFATHYHELTVLENEMSGVKNYNIACKKRGDDITFLRRIIPGGADESYGIEVSKLAGVPDWVIKRARQVLEQLEAGKQPESKARKDRNQEMLPQMSFGEVIPSKAEQVLRDMDVDTLTPIEALNKLYELKKLL